MLFIHRKSEKQAALVLAQVTSCNSWTTVTYFYIHCVKILLRKNNIYLQQSLSLLNPR